MAQHQPPKREERTEGHRRLSARTEAKTCLRLLQYQPGKIYKYMDDEGNIKLPESTTTTTKPGSGVGGGGGEVDA